MIILYILSYKTNLCGIVPFIIAKGQQLVGCFFSHCAVQSYIAFGCKLNLINCTFHLKSLQRDMAIIAKIKKKPMVVNRTDFWIFRMSYFEIMKF